MTEHEAVELSKNIDDELEARIINDEVDAHTINNDLVQVSETFDSLEAEGVDVMAPEKLSKEAIEMQQKMVNYWKSKANHQPNTEHILSDTTYVVQANGSWARKEPKHVTNPNIKNKQIRNKLARHPKKYLVINI